MEYRDQTLYLEELPLADIARREGTPSYVYSRAAILDRFQAYDRAFGDVAHKVCFAVKANSNLSILKLLAEAGAGFDIVSGGELFRALKAGADPADHHFLRRRQDFAGDRFRARAPNQKLQLRVRARTGADRFARRPPWDPGACRVAREPGHRRLSRILTSPPDCAITNSASISRKPRPFTNARDRSRTWCSKASVATSAPRSPILLRCSKYSTR